jgi:phosphate-selective porin
MKKIFTLLLLSVAGLTVSAQTAVVDSLKEVISNHDGKLTALDDRVLVNETDLSKLNKIKVSGYIQAQWEDYGKDLVKTNEPTNTFYIRRARVKFTYEPADGVKFVLQPDFSTGNLSLKDAYAVVNVPFLKDWTLWAGQFNRPDYEVEYSSGSRETLERSRLIRAIYPGEREIGAKLEYNGSKIPLKFQLMAMNGNFTGANAKDADSRKDIMARLVYSAKMPSAGLGIDFGLNGYFGGNRAKTNQYVLEPNGILDSLTVGNYLKKQWFGAEVQVYADVLGGLSLKGEYISGTNSSASTTASTATMAAKKADPNKINNFSGYYLYLVKNIGNKNQLVTRYDYYDPNTKLSGDAAGASVNYKTITLAWQYYLNDNIRITAQYEMPQNEKSASVKNVAGTGDVQLNDNTFSIRIQTKF